MNRILSCAAGCLDWLIRIIVPRRICGRTRRDFGFGTVSPGQQFRNARKNTPPVSGFNGAAGWAAGGIKPRLRL